MTEYSHRPKTIDQPSLDVLVAHFPPSSNFIRLSPHPLIRPALACCLRGFAEGNPLSASAFTPKIKTSIGLRSMFSLHTRLAERLEGSFKISQFATTPFKTLRV
jgi:hypothetical protein